MPWQTPASNPAVELGALAPDHADRVLDIPGTAGEQLMDEKIFGSGEGHRGPVQGDRHGAADGLLLVGRGRKDEIHSDPRLRVAGGQHERFRHEAGDIVRQGHEPEVRADLQDLGQTRGINTEGEVDVFREAGSSVEQDRLSADDHEGNAVGVQLAGERGEERRRRRAVSARLPGGDFRSSSVVAASRRQRSVLANGSGEPLRDTTWRDPTTSATPR